MVEETKRMERMRVTTWKHNPNKRRKIQNTIMIMHTGAKKPINERKDESPTVDFVIENIVHHKIKARRRHPYVKALEPL